MLLWKAYVCVILDINTCSGTGPSEWRSGPRREGSRTVKTAKQGQESPGNQALFEDGVFEIVLPWEEGAVAPVGRSYQLCPHSEETLSGSSHWPKKGLGNHSWLRDWPPPLQFRGSSSLHRDRKATAPQPQRWTIGLKVFPHCAKRAGTIGPLSESSVSSGPASNSWRCLFLSLNNMYVIKLWEFG